MNESDHYFKEIFPQDLDVYGISIKDKDFKQSNIFANRIMSNAYLFNHREIGIIGHILKEIAIDGTNLQQSKEPAVVIEYAKKSSKVVGGIIAMIEKNTIDLHEAWTLYYDQQKATNRMFMTKVEQDGYVKPDELFTSELIDQVLRIFEENITVLLERNNNLIKGILNEIGRAAKDHGLTRDDEHFLSLFRAVQRIDEYHRGVTKGDGFVRITKEKLMSFVDKIIEINHKRKTSNFDEVVIDDLLWELVKLWRYYFIKYTDIMVPQFSIKEEKMSSEGEEESELVEEVKKQIEKEMRGK